MEKKYNFVYLTTNLINGKQYVGDHSTNDLDCAKTRHYFGSGKYLINALYEYRKENFKKEILEWFETKEEAYNAQKKYIDKYNTLVPNGYNLSPTGGTQFGGIQSEETKMKISIKNTGKIQSKEARAKMSKAKKGLFVGENHPFFAKHHTEECKQQIREKITGQRCGTRHHYFGKHRDENTKQLISKSLIGTITPDEVKETLRNKSLNVIKVTCEHCQKQFTPWGLVHHNKALKRKEYINKLNN